MARKTVKHEIGFDNPISAGERTKSKNPSCHVRGPSTILTTKRQRASSPVIPKAYKDLEMPARIRPNGKRRGRPPKPVAIDLFSGCGGMTLGLKRAGFRVVGAIELEALAVETYKKNHPGTHVWHGDICDVTVAEVQRKLGLEPRQLDLLAGCPPCQAFSRLRTLNGKRRVRDEQKDLVLEFARFVRVLRPRAVMLENVPKLARDPRLKELKTILRDLGYRVDVKVLNAADFGVPQRRRRMILVAGRVGQIEFAPQSTKRRSVAGAIKQLTPPDRSRDRLHNYKDLRSPDVEELIRTIPHDGGSRSDIPDEDQLDCHKRCDGFYDVYGRMAWTDVAPTITSGCINPSKGRFLHPEQDRAITLREAALLQSFPRDYHFSLRRGKYPAAEMIGNALPPEFVRRQAETVREYLREAFPG